MMSFNVISWSFEGDLKRGRLGKKQISQVCRNILKMYKKNPYPDFLED